MILRSYKPEYFDVKELVSPSLYERRGESAIMLMSAYVMHSMDAIRQAVATLADRDVPLTVNDWAWGGERVASGRREPGDPYYSATSQHASGNAIDCINDVVPAQAIREYIVDNRNDFPFVTCLEFGVDWLHIDCRNLPPNAPDGAILAVYPSKHKSRYV